MTKFLKFKYISPIYTEAEGVDPLLMPCVGLYASSKKAVYSVDSIHESFKNKIDIYGTFASYKVVEEYQLELLRDPAGSRKLFYAYNTKDRMIYFSSSYLSLTKLVSDENIFSVPRGSMISIDLDGKVLTLHKVSSRYAENYKIDQLINDVKESLSSYLNAVNEMSNNQTVYIALSGGLDSTLILCESIKYIKKIEAITVVLLDPDDYQSYKTTGIVDQLKYIDYARALSIANMVGVTHHLAVFSKENLLRDLDAVMAACQDWRDHNVHCALLNYQLGKFLSEKDSRPNRMVLTGDYMNEIFSDYTSEKIGDTIFYPQISMADKVRQRFLLRGLDSSDREIGVLSAWGICCLQPFSVTINYYQSVGDELFDRPNPKYTINGSLIPKDVFNLVGLEKVRAQNGDTNGGILGYLIKESVDQLNLKNRFLKYHKLPFDWENKFIMAGQYRIEN